MTNKDEKKEYRKQKKAQKKLKRKQRKLLYKVKHQTGNPNKVLYAFELFFASIVDTFVFLLNVLLSIVLGFCGIGLVGSLIFLIVMKVFINPKYESYLTIAKEITKESTPDDFKINEGSVIYDSNGDVLAELYDTSFLTYLEYDEIPKDTVNAFVAIEDRTFWKNDGVDYYGIARVLFNYVKTKGAEAHGASTITQQLSRTIYLTREVSIERKIKEILVARELTKMYSKEQIMEFYVNTCCFSNGIYGIQGAAQAYFGVDAKDLTLAQTTYLCAIPNRPAYYNPYEDITRPYERQHKILKDMLDEGYITQKEYENALNEKIELVETQHVFNDYLTTYAVDCSIRYLMEQDKFEFRYTFDDMDDYTAYKTKYDEVYSSYKDKFYTGGYRVYTTLDKEVYTKMQEVLDKQLDSYNTSVNEETGIYNLQGALTVIDNETGKVVSVVGGRSQENDTRIYSLNRAYQSYRQPGSSIKPIVVYAPAIERGYTPNTKVYNIDVSKAKEQGVDAQKLTGESMTLRSAVEQSKNGVAWQIFDKLTPTVGLSYATSMRFSHIVPEDYYNSSALGGLTYGVSTVEMASAYATLANHGYYIQPTCIEHLYDSDGNDIYTESKKESIYTAYAADTMVDICKGVLTRGTASGIGWGRKSKTEAFGKTGTTNDNKDVWFCGATPYYSISVWVGYDTPKKMPGVYGASYPAQIWRDCMLQLIDGKEDMKFEKLESEYEATVSGDGSKYLEGRDDDEVLSDGYTVGDYRSDRLIGEQIQAIIDKMLTLNTKGSKYKSELKELYSEGQNLVDTIYSQKYTTEMRLKLQTTYENLTGGLSDYTGSGDSAAQTGNEVPDAPVEQPPVEQPPVEQPPVEEQVVVEPIDPVVLN